MLRNLLNYKFNKQSTLILEWTVYFKFTVIFGITTYINFASAQNHFNLYTAIHTNKNGIYSDNFNISNKSFTQSSFTPILGLNYSKDKTSFGLELKYLKVNYYNNFNYSDKIGNNSVKNNYKGKYISLSFLTKQNIYSIHNSSFAIYSMLNFAYNNTPFDETTSIYGPNTYILNSHTKFNSGVFYSLSLGLSYEYKINNKYGILLSTQLNSNYNRTLVEEINTIAYPDQTMAYQFFKINGQGFSVNVGLIYKLTKKDNISKIQSHE
jgi:hypothetical protein